MFPSLPRSPEGAIFRGANLRNADLESGNYEMADFGDAVMEGAFVNNAQFVKVRGAGPRMGFGVAGTRRGWAGLSILTAT